MFLISRAFLLTLLLLGTSSAYSQKTEEEKKIVELIERETQVAMS
jgi:hypothetical protein